MPPVPESDPPALAFAATTRFPPLMAPALTTTAADCGVAFPPAPVVPIPPKLLLPTWKDPGSPFPGSGRMLITPPSSTSTVARPPWALPPVAPLPPVFCAIMIEPEPRLAVPAMTSKVARPPDPLPPAPVPEPLPPEPPATPPGKAAVRVPPFWTTMKRLPPWPFPPVMFRPLSRLLPPCANMLKWSGPPLRVPPSTLIVPVPATPRPPVPPSIDEPPPNPRENRRTSVVDPPLVGRLIVPPVVARISITPPVPVPPIPVPPVESPPAPVDTSTADCAKLSNRLDGVFWIVMTLPASRDSI